MAGTDFLRNRFYSRSWVSGISLDNKDVALRIRYVGSGSAVKTAVVTTATKLTLTTDAGAVDYTWAAYTTLGALADGITASGIWEAKVLDGLRSMSTATTLFVDSTITAAWDGVEMVWDMLWDTASNTANRACYRLTYDRTFGKSSKLKAGHRVHLSEIVTNVTLGGGADANALKIYEVSSPETGSTETLVYQKTPTSGSSNTTSWASGNGFITAGDGNDLVVVLTDGTSITGSMVVSGIRE